MTNANPRGRPSEPVPRAHVVQQTARRIAAIYGAGWILLLAGLVTLVMVTWSRWDRGQPIVIHFQDGHGLKAGDAVRHRGIEVGRVRNVWLNERMNGIDVHCDLMSHAVGLAREGSRFWIEHPRVSLSRLSGLDTVMGAKYISVVPASFDAPRASEFQGLEHPLSLGEGEDTVVTVRFLQGFGLSVGDHVKHRGITIGEVIDVTLDESLRGVTVRVRLVGTARLLARGGTQFWIVRPSVTLSEVRGLDTLVGGRYLAVAPGPVDAPELMSFQGLEEPPPSSHDVDGGLEIVLETDQRRGWEKGSPVSYRGMRIGEVLSVAVASDALTVEARAMIDPNFRGLIRDNTRFWDDSGMDVHVGLSGLDLNMGTLESLAKGGISLATPEPPGAIVHTGHRFEVEPEPAEDWETWRPNLVVGSAELPPGSLSPSMLRAEIVTQTRRLGFTRELRRTGWVLPLDSGDILAPATLLAPASPTAENGEGETGTLEFHGLQLELRALKTRAWGRITRITPPEPLPEDCPTWPEARLRAATVLEDCLVIAGIGDPPLALSPRRLVDKPDHWQIDPAVPLDEDWQGAAVIGRRDGLLVGIAEVHRGQATVALIPAAASIIGQP